MHEDVIPAEQVNVGVLALVKCAQCDEAVEPEIEMQLST